jgi:NTP pyrophosphatase (non-canonical NTP hydrolase)
MIEDSDTTLGTLRQAVAGFVDARDWRPFHSPKNLSMSIAIEAAELMERFQWLSNEEAWASVAQPEQRAAVTDELADVMIYCFSLSNALELDVTSAVLGKLKANENRYPKDEFQGRFRRPERQKVNQSLTE